MRHFFFDRYAPCIMMLCIAGCCFMSFTWAEPAADSQPAQSGLMRELNEYKAMRSTLVEELLKQPGIRESVLKQLAEKGFLTLHDHKEDYPRKEDFEELDEIYTPPKPPPAPEKPVAPPKPPVATPAPPMPPAPATVPPQKPKSLKMAGNVAIRDIVSKWARHFKVEEALVYAVIEAESDFNPYARSHAGACGLMQLMPDTARFMGVDDIFDVNQNIYGGTGYLAYVLRLFNQDLERAVAAYNAGPGSIKRYGWPPSRGFEETKKYVPKVLRLRTKYAATIPEIKVAVKSAAPDPLKFSQPEGKAYILVFKNGLTQPARAIREDGKWYYVEFDKRQERVAKDTVQDILLKG